MCRLQASFTVNVDTQVSDEAYRPYSLVDYKRFIKSMNKYCVEILMFNITFYQIQEQILR
jgi:hypothetical protein